MTAWRPALLGLGGYDLAGGSLVRRWARQVDLAGPVTELAPLEPADLVLVNDGDLAYAKVRLDPGSLALALAHVSRLDDPLARAVTWSMLWDMTRDAELGAREFVTRVVQGVAGETDSSGMQKLLEAVATALEFYTAPAYRVAATVQTAERLWELTEAVQPESDAQLQLVRAYSRHVTAEGQIDRLEEIVTGARSLTGLAIDADLAWDLMGGLVVTGRFGEERIDQQLAVDPTSRGLERAAGLRAAQPTPEAKAAAWLRAVEDPATPNETLRSVVEGWNLVRDPALLVPFIEPYFGGLERIWRTRTPQVASTIARGLYPSIAATEPGVDVVALTDQFLEELGPELSPLRRLVAEGRDGVVRALAAQATDAAQPPLPR
jgi:aminopeptidase N